MFVVLLWPLQLPCTIASLKAFFPEKKGMERERTTTKRKGKQREQIHPRADELFLTSTNVYDSRAFLSACRLPSVGFSLFRTNYACGDRGNRRGQLDQWWVWLCSNCTDKSAGVDNERARGYSVHQWRLCEKNIYCGAKVLSIEMISILRKVACVFQEGVLCTCLILI